LNISGGIKYVEELDLQVAESVFIIKEENVLLGGDFLDHIADISVLDSSNVN
jgi:hypothetical protein